MRMRKPQPATLQGRAVRLRPVTAEDAPRLTEILTQPEVARWWGRFDRDRVQRELVDPDGTVTFVIQADGQAIGLIQYWEEPDPDYRSPPCADACGTRSSATGDGIDVPCLAVSALGGPWRGGPLVCLGDL
jgi:Acetyltransferase (GNAT) domain